MARPSSSDGHESIRIAKRLGSAGIVLAILGCYAFYSYPAWVGRINDVRREKLSSLNLPADMKRKIIAGDPVAVRWLEQKAQSGKGSIPALLLLQSMTGETFAQVPNYCRGYAVCGNMSDRQVRQMMNENFRALREQEKQAFADYQAKKGSLAYDRLQDIDLQNLQSVWTAITRAWEKRDGGRLYLLIAGESEGPDFFYYPFRYFELLKENSELSFRIDIRKRNLGRIDSYVEIINEADPNEGPQGHGLYLDVFCNPETQFYEIQL